MPSLPRVILVGGAPLSGKTTLGVGIARRLGIDHIATDDLSTAVRAITDADSHPALHVPDVDGSFSSTYAAQQPDRLLTDAVAFHRAIWPAIEPVILAHATWDRPAVIEGWSLLPELLGGLGQRDVGALLVIPDEAVYERRCRADASFWEGATDAEGLIRSFVARSIRFSRMLERSAMEHGVPILRPAPGSDLEETVDIALKLLEPPAP